MESTVRLNLALCKFNMKDFDTAIDQCERVLDSDSKNAKACFRIAQSMYAKHDKFEGQTDDVIRGSIRQIFNYAKKAHNLLPNDVKTKEFYQEIDLINTRVTTAPSEETKQGPTAAESKGLKRVIVDDPEEVKQKKEAQAEPKIEEVKR